MWKNTTSRESSQRCSTLSFMSEILILSYSWYSFFSHPQIKYLSTLVTKEELVENGIDVSGPTPHRVPLMTFPKFNDDCSSLLKKFLNRDVWNQLKKRSTPQGGNIQLSVQSGVQNQNSHIGVFATDEEAYRVFEELFTPILKDLHPDFNENHPFKHEFDVEKLSWDEKLRPHLDVSLFW